ncbi:MAG: hypothetical protein RSA22_14200 [Acinetobacter sp.]|jgi:hypothetical protein
MTLENWSYVATIASVLGASIAFILNVQSQIRQRSIENCLRYFEYHNNLFSEDSYLRKNVASMENGSFQRNETNEDMEKAFREMLSDFEKFALLQKAGGAPESINAYMLGYFAKHVHAAINTREKAEPYWDLAIEFICETKKAAEKFDSLSKADRLKYISKNHF